MSSERGRLESVVSDRLPDDDPLIVWLARIMQRRRERLADNHEEQRKAS